MAIHEPDTQKVISEGTPSLVDWIEVVSIFLVASIQSTRLAVPLEIGKVVYPEQGGCLILPIL